MHLLRIKKSNTTELSSNKWTVLQFNVNYTRVADASIKVTAGELTADVVFYLSERLTRVINQSERLTWIINQGQPLTKLKAHSN